MTSDCLTLMQQKCPIKSQCASHFAHKPHLSFPIDLCLVISPQRIQLLGEMNRYSNLQIVKWAENRSKGLIKCLKKTFILFGISEELAIDRGGEFTSKDT